MSFNFVNNPSPHTSDDQYSYYGDSSNNATSLELSELLSLNEWADERDRDPPNWFTTTVDNAPIISVVDGSSTATTEDNRSGEVTKERVSFKTKSEVEVLDDGYRWRKYGKKMVKNNHNPRNYYKCSSEGCPVKKRVERDRDDPSYVITTYEGLHTHHF